MSKVNDALLKKMTYNGEKVKKWFHEGVNVFSAGSTVTYYVDTNTVYTEEVDSDATCLTPKTFAIEKTGYDFVGWREDKVASSSVLIKKVMESEPITLYAVFRKKVTVTYYNGSTVKKQLADYRYYNNGVISNPSFTLDQATKSGWAVRGWSAGTSADAAIAYDDAETFELATDTTLYGMYYKTITLSYAGNGATGGATAAQPGTRYYNSNGNILNPTFIISGNGFVRNGYTFAGWDIGAVGVAIELDTNATATAAWVRDAISYGSKVLNGTGGDFAETQQYPNQIKEYLSVDCTDFRYLSFDYTSEGVSVGRWAESTSADTYAGIYPSPNKFIGNCWWVSSMDPEELRTEGFGRGSAILDISELSGIQKFTAWGTGDGPQWLLTCTNIRTYN